jgi:hypothetical protein
VQIAPYLGSLSGHRLSHNSTLPIGLPSFSLVALTPQTFTDYPISQLLLGYTLLTNKVSITSGCAIASSFWDPCWVAAPIWDVVFSRERRGKESNHGSTCSSKVPPQMWHTSSSFTSRCPKQTVWPCLMSAGKKGQSGWLYHKPHHWPTPCVLSTQG